MFVKIACIMTEERRSKKFKPSYTSHISKRSKLTLSLKSDSLLRSSTNCELEQIFTGTLQDGLLQLPTGKVCKCSTPTECYCSTWGTKASKVGVNDPEDDVISIKSDSVKLEEDAPLNEHSEAKSSDTPRDVTNIVEHKPTSEDGLRKRYEDGNLPTEDKGNIDCSLQATCHTVASALDDGMLRTENSSGSPDDVGDSGALVSDGARKVAAWLTDVCVGGLEDDDPVMEEPELESEGDLGAGRTEQRVTSEFFSEGEELVVQCPLCCKRLERKATAHLKLCAARHRVTTQQLLEALALQRRQTEERHALGLPAVAASAPSKKPPATRKGSSSGDANLQLALALSASLQEAEEREQDVLLDSGVAEPGSLSPTVVQRQRSLLEQFGFTTSRPAVPCGRAKTGASKARLKSYPLLSRTQEDRERLMTEKVAIILMGEEEGEGERAPPGSHGERRGATAVTSDLLVRLQDKENQLWEMARDVSADVDKDLYYVDSLASQISPCKLEPGAKLKHLSQIDGRINTPKRPADCKDFKAIGSSFVSSEIKSPKLKNQQVRAKLKKVKKLLDFSPVARSSLRADSSAKRQTSSHGNALSGDWASVMNKQAMSDVTIHVAGGREIPAHKLVFYARCPALLYDLIKEESNGKVRELLTWMDVSYKAALAFLEFLYCGTMERILHLGDDALHLKNLASRYQVTEVVQHLDVMHRVRARVSNDGGYSSNASISSTSAKEYSLITERCFQKNDILSDPSNKNCVEKETILVCSSPFSKTENTCATPTSDKITPVCRPRSVSGFTSPDMFDTECTAEGNASLDECTTEGNVSAVDGTIEDNVSQGSRTSVDCLLSLMNKANASGSDRKDDVEGTSCELQSPDVFVGKKRKLRIEVNDKSCEKVFSEGLIDGDQISLDVDKSFSDTISVENICAQTNKTFEENISCALNTESKKSFKSPEISVTHLPTMDLTQDSSDEELTQQDRPLKEDCSGDAVCIDFRPVGKNNDGTDSEELHGSEILNDCPQDKQANTDIIEIEQETEQKIGCGTNLDHNVSVIDNVWDDFDDLGVVPNLSFYTSPSHNHKMFGATCNSGRKSSSPSTKLSPASGSSPGSAVKNHRNTGRTQSGASCAVSPPGEASRAAETVDGSYRALLDDSLVDTWNSSALWRDEPRVTAGTPEEPVKVLVNKVTPLPDYSTMKTPRLKKELFRYGLKPLNRKHAKQILRHIYSELHPSAGGEGSGGATPQTHPVAGQSSKSLFKEPGPDTVAPRSPRKRLSASPSPNKSASVEARDHTSGSDCEELSQASTCSSASSVSSMAEEMILEMETLSQAEPEPSGKDAVDFRSAVRGYIKRTPELYEKILLYEPVWLEELQADLKAQKLRFNVKQLMDFLDEQCITFRTAQGQRSRARRKERKRKSSGCLTQPCRGRPRKKVCSQPS